MTNDSYIYQGNSHRIFHDSLSNHSNFQHFFKHTSPQKKSNTFHGDGVHEAEPVKSHFLYTHDSAYFGRVKCEVVEITWPEFAQAITTGVGVRDFLSINSSIHQVDLRKTNRFHCKLTFYIQNWFWEFLAKCKTYFGYIFPEKTY